MAATKKSLLSGFVLLLAVMMAFVYLKYYRQAFDGPLYVISLVKDRNYGRLESIYVNLIAEYHAGSRDEIALFKDFEVFLNSDPDFEPALQGWLNEMPDSLAAKLALGRHTLHLGWLSRGAGWRKDTKQDQLEKMQGYFAQAYDYYVAASQQDPRLILPYYGILNIAMANGSDELNSMVVARANSVHPESYLFNFMRLYGLQPKWGGSMEEIKQVIEGLENFYASNPRLEWLKGFEAYAQAGEVTRTRWNQQSCAVAISYLTEALAQYPEEYIYIGRAKYHRCVNDYDRSIADYTKALEINRHNHQTYIGRGYSYYWKGLYDSAIADLDKAIELDKMNSDALRYRGLAHYYLEKYDKAETDLIASLQYGAYKYQAHSMLGYIYYHQHKDYVQAEDAFSRAVEYGDKTPQGLLMIADSQHRQKDCKFIPTAKQYIAVCENNKGCNVQSVSWARNSIMHVQREGTCPKA